MRRIAPAVILAIVLLAGCGGEVDLARTGAGAAQVRFFEDLYDGKFAQVYATLHPAHQAIVSKELFIRCARDSIAVHKLDSIEVLDVFDDNARILGVTGGRRKAVRIQLTSTSGETQEPRVNHEVEVGGRWRWVLNADAIRAYRAGNCPR